VTENKLINAKSNVFFFFQFSFFTLCNKSMEVVSGISGQEHGGNLSYM